MAWGQAEAKVRPISHVGDNHFTRENADAPAPRVEGQRCYTLAAVGAEGESIFQACAHLCIGRARCAEAEVAQVA